MLVVKWCGLVVSGLYFCQQPQLYHNMASIPGSLFISFNALLPLFAVRFEDSLSHVCTCPLYILFCISPSKASLLPSYIFSDGMCSCCLLFPIAVFASQHGDFGIAAELRCHGSGPCCRTGYTWDLESLFCSPHSLFPIYSTFLSGFLRCSRSAAPFCLIPSLTLHSHITNESIVTCIMRHI